MEKENSTLVILFSAEVKRYDSDIVNKKSGKQLKQDLGGRKGQGLEFEILT